MLFFKHQSIIFYYLLVLNGFSNASVDHIDLFPRSKMKRADVETKNIGRNHIINPICSA
ncbi:hypothetical protein THOM_2847 [Trachipleistophora hominis]|uniref:Transposable element encoded protein n=1 Tax=Trachipleistophora hominis TaxID=72359 RepID=L7JSH1_TRAHO|nr:hypothetical protein THOM_2847 [Trachipleistophora hominis]